MSKYPTIFPPNSHLPNFHNSLAGHFTDYGIDDDFIKEVRGKVTEGTSALFLLSADATVDKVSEAFKGTKMELIQSNLTAEQETNLRLAFGEE